MKKIVRQQNYLRTLINSQENKLLTKQTLKNVIRAVLVPLLDNPEDGVVLYRIINQSGLTGLLKRLQFSTIEALDFSDESGNIKEKVWADTEFICVMTHRFVAIMIWDNKTENKNYVKYYSMWNSKLQDETLDIINRNSQIDIKPFQDKFRPDRRDNILLNSSIRRLVDNIDESIKDAVLGFAEFQFKPVAYTADVREISHEVKNQLSICDLYSEIIKKYCEKNNIQDETVLNAAKCISKAVKMSSNSLLALKSIQKAELNECDLKDVIDTVENLTKVYFECNNIDYLVESKANMKVSIDEDGFISVLINLVKNAVEAFNYVEKEDELKDGKYVKLKVEKRGEFVAIRVINNASKINEPEKVFNKGFTTKNYGSGLGLSICQKSIEDMEGTLVLKHSDDEYTEFLIKLKLI